MKKINIVDFFSKINYSWEENKDILFEVCRLTNTREGHTEEKIGNEHAFLMNAILRMSDTKNFFEIGTGRGKQVMHACMIPEMEEIVTLDVYNFNEKRRTPVNGVYGNYSNLDLYNMFNHSEKEKIKYMHVDSFDSVDYKKRFGVVFIDGDHHNENVIYNDFLMSMEVLKPQGYIVFDDYNHPNLTAPKNVVNRVKEEYPEFEYTLIEHRGHIFNHQPKHVNEGMVIIKVK